MAITNTTSNTSLDLSGLIEAAIEEQGRKIMRENRSVSFDTKTITLASIAVSLRRIADCLEAKRDT